MFILTFDKMNHQFLKVSADSTSIFQLPFCKTAKASLMKLSGHPMHDATDIFAIRGSKQRQGYLVHKALYRIPRTTE